MGLGRSCSECEQGVARAALFCPWCGHKLPAGDVAEGALPAEGPTDRRQSHRWGIAVGLAVVVLAATAAAVVAGRGETDKGANSSTLAASERATTTTTTLAKTIVTHPATTTTVATTTTTALPAYDIEWAKADGCRTDTLDFMHARGTIKNQRFLDQTYTIHAVFIDSAGVRVADGLTFVSDLHAGQTATWEVLMGQVSSPDTGQCQLDSVEVR